MNADTPHTLIDRARAALDALALPDGTPLGPSGRIMGLNVSNGRLDLAIRVAPHEAHALAPLRQAAEAALRALPGAQRVMVVLTAEGGGAPPRPAPPSAGPVAGPVAGPASGAFARPAASSIPAGLKPVATTPPRPAALEGVRHVIAVASGKGGVGKSTTAVNLALALRAQGLRVGLLDADIYGPSLPTLLGLHGKPRAAAGDGAGRRLLPMDAFGLKAMSMGLLVDAESAMIWRGPMVTSAITQMLNDVDWGRLDVLIVDMPPGTGDAQLALAQGTRLAGAVIVSTPQDLALIDARRGITMFRKVEVPVLGIIENMAHFLCPTCGAQHAIFGQGGARAEATRLDVPFLGAVPLTMELRAASDSGQPITARDPDGMLGQIYGTIARQVWHALEPETV
ncbi:MAG: P-loop NTPase [Pararhodobacter sp.]